MYRLMEAVASASLRRWRNSSRAVWMSLLRVRPRALAATSASLKGVGEGNRDFQTNSITTWNTTRNALVQRVAAFFAADFRAETPDFPPPIRGFRTKVGRKEGRDALNERIARGIPSGYTIGLKIAVSFPNPFQGSRRRRKGPRSDAQQAHPDRSRRVPPASERCGGYGFHQSIHREVWGGAERRGRSLDSAWSDNDAPDPRRT